MKVLPSHTYLVAVTRALSCQESLDISSKTCHLKEASSSQESLVMSSRSCHLKKVLSSLGAVHGPVPKICHLSDGIKPSICSFK